ncbi:YbaK/EbsC family protein [Bifidobacterium sp. ESL0790]|uniref:YbaK/EbsC family protein n=1 Tax=Bifidobacterium sp. ESL0790 TaxID=2983233 RepID=UPI0023F6CDF1|nr:YbaK/EbsC family protein [Bifidobacterium sp. ESL0790]WEV72676.1 hypothetical protein OZY47_01435 [Bifidobacterium sp. ESL0790]
MTELDDGNNAYYKRRLDQFGIQYRTIRHAPVTTMEHSSEFDCMIVKNLLIRNKRDYSYILVMAAPQQRVDFKRLAQILDTSRSSLNFATDDELAKELGTTSGLVSPLAVPEKHIENLRFLIDADFCDQPRLGFHAGKSTETLVVSYSDLERFSRMAGYTLTPIQM